MNLSLTPYLPPSAKKPNTQRIITQPSSTKPKPFLSLVHYDWPDFVQADFEKICRQLVSYIYEIKQQIPSDNYRDNDVECCPPALINIAKDMIQLFIKNKITTQHATTNYKDGYIVLILAVIGYYLIQNEWQSVYKLYKQQLQQLQQTELFDDSMMVIMLMVKSGFGHLDAELDAELRKITKRLFIVDQIRPIQKPNNGGGRKRLTRRRRRKLKPSKRRTKHYKLII